LTPEKPRSYQCHVFGTAYKTRRFKVFALVFQRFRTARKPVFGTLFFGPVLLFFVDFYALKSSNLMWEKIKFKFVNISALASLCPHKNFLASNCITAHIIHAGQCDRSAKTWI